MGLESGTARKGLPDIVFERMLRAIKSGAYKPDERLPTEHDLATEFEVSRPVIREALRRLREQGLIYSRRGAGSFTDFGSAIRWIGNPARRVRRCRRPTS